MHPRKNDTIRATEKLLTDSSFGEMKRHRTDSGTELKSSNFSIIDGKGQNTAKISAS